MLMSSPERNHDENIEEMLAMLAEAEEDERLETLSLSVNFEELSQLGKAIKNETHNFGVHKSIHDTAKFIAYHIGNLLTTKPRILLDSYSAKLLAITSTVGEFAKKVLLNKATLNGIEKKEIQKIYDMLKKIPDLPLPFENSSCAKPAQSLNTSIGAFLKQLEEIK